MTGIIFLLIAIAGGCAAAVYMLAALDTMERSLGELRRAVHELRQGIVGAQEGLRAHSIRISAAEYEQESLRDALGRVVYTPARGIVRYLGQRNEERNLRAAENAGATSEQFAQAASEIAALWAEEGRVFPCYRAFAGALTAAATKQLVKSDDHGE